jgi:MFS superfamily sulfate permease-like transporter
MSTTSTTVPRLVLPVRTALTPHGPRPASPQTRNLRVDFLASLVVFLVALPLCLGIAQASGMPPVAGLITGIVGGLVVGFLAGSPLQVSGPAAGLTVLILALVRDPNLGPGMVGLVVLLAGLMQATAGLARLGQWFRAVSPAVIEGMLAGIGALIFCGQFHVLIDGKPYGNGLENLAHIPHSLWQGLNPAGGQADAAFRVGVITLAALVGWKAFAPKKLKLIPAPLLAIVVASLASLALVAAGWHHAVNLVEVPTNVLGELRPPSGDTWRRAFEAPVLIAALTVALIASAETLLCAGAVDAMHTGPRAKYDRELWAQGVGNVVCGLLGGLPMTGVIVRSAANVEAGGKTRLSAVLHGVWLLLAAVLLAAALGLVPTAALAAVLVYTGWKLMDFRKVKELWRYGRAEVAIYLATMLTIVATDLLKGVLVGLALALCKLLLTFARLKVRLEDDPDGNRSVLRLKGAATFLRLPKLAAALEAVPPGTELHVNLEGLTFIDHACLELFMTWEKQHQATGGSLVLDWKQLTARFR